LGKTSKPLTIAVAKSISGWPKWQELAAQGHTIVELEEIDVFMGPECWYMDQQHEKLVDDALAAARVRAYPPKPKEKK
jgi:hypothetical protein